MTLCYFVPVFLSTHELQPSVLMQVQRNHMPHSNSCEYIIEFKSSNYRGYSNCPCIQWAKVCKSRRVLQLLLVVAGGGSQSRNREHQWCVLPSQTRPVGDYQSNSHHLLLTCAVCNVLCHVLCPMISVPMSRVLWSRFETVIYWSHGMEHGHGLGQGPVQRRTCCGAICLNMGMHPNHACT